MCALPRRSRQLALDATVVAVAAIGILAVVYRLWNADLSVPFVYLEPDRSPLTYAPDAPFYLMIVKGAIDHGWFLDNPSLGFPFGQALHEFPQGLDNLNLLLLQVIGWVTGDVFLTINLFFLLTFVGVPIAAYLVGRRLGLSRLAGMVVALLFTFLPFHFTRGTAHLLLSAYWLVPVAALLLVQVVSARPPFTVDTDTPRGWRVACAHALVDAVAPRLRRTGVHRLVLRGAHDHARRRGRPRRLRRPAQPARPGRRRARGVGDPGHGRGQPHPHLRVLGRARPQRRPRAARHERDRGQRPEGLPARAAGRGAPHRRPGRGPGRQHPLHRDQQRAGSAARRDRRGRVPGHGRGAAGVGGAPPEWRRRR